MMQNSVRMAVFSTIFFVVLVFTSHYAQAGNVKASKIHGSSVFDVCANMCDKIYPNGRQYMVNPRMACRHGCQVVCHLQLGTDSPGLDYNSSKNLCHKACFLKFGSLKDRYACNLGCACKMLPSLPVAPPLFDNWYSVQNDDAEPDDVLLDPALRTQVQKDGGPLPRLHIQTLPRHSSMEEVYQQLLEYEPYPQDQSETPFKTWYDYHVQHTSTFTRIFLGGLLLLSILALLCLGVVSTWHLVAIATGRPSGLPLPVPTAPPPSEWLSCPIHGEEEDDHPPKYSNVTADPPKYGDIAFAPPPTPPPKYAEIVDMA